MTDYPTMPGSISVSLGNQAYFCIDRYGEMFIEQIQGSKTTQRISLGAATEKRLDTILLHMSHLRIHTERN